LGLGIGLLLALFLIAALVAYTQLRSLEQKLRQVTEIEEPAGSAALEMEINLIGTGFALLGYLHDHDPLHLQRLRDDQSDFEKFLRQYHELAQTQEYRTLGLKVDQGYTRFRALADRLIRIEDEQTERP